MAHDGSGAGPRRLDDVIMDLRVSVGGARPTVKELLALGENDVLLLDRRVEDPVELYVGDKLIARGQLEEAETGDGRLCIRLTEVLGPQGHG